MTITEFGVTPDGFKIKRLVDVKTDLDNRFISEFGDVNLDPQSVVGQIIGIFSKVFADIWENEQDVYLSQYPNSASGISLDNIVALNGITRIPAQRTLVTGVAYGIEGTLIPQGSLARIPVTNALFESTLNAFITSSNAVQNIVEVINLAPQAYTIVIDNQTYIYSKPILNFSAPFTAPNTITIRLNDVTLATIPYTTSSANTFLLLKAQLELQPSVANANIVGNTIVLTPNVGEQIVINSVIVTGGGVTYSLTFDTPVSTSNIAMYLSARLNTNSKIVSTYNLNEITITAVDTDSPYSILTGLNLSITQVASPVPFQAQTFGVIPAPVGSLTEIVTPVSGWISLTNFQAGITGRNQETDTELRLRRANSTRLQGTATVEAIRARLLQDVAGVTAVTIYENVTMTMTPLEVVFSIDFVSGDQIQVYGDMALLGLVNWSTDQLTTMNLIKALLEAQPEILSAIVGGTGNREIVVTFNPVQSLLIDFVITGGIPLPTFRISGGRPPKSFETVVEGGSDQAVALKIWQTKPAGIQTFGNTNVVIVDSQGNNQAIQFSRAIPVYMYAIITITLNPQETFPVNGLQLIANSILAYGNNLGIGIDVIIQRIESLAFLTQGVATASAQLAKVYDLNDAPSYVITDIDISAVEASSWDINRIVVTV